MAGKFDVATAVGAQLDVVGQWIGRSRFVSIPIPNVFFSFGINGLGFGQGYWRGKYDPTSGLTRLDDDTYRRLLMAKIGANRWDGTQSGAAAILATVFTDPVSYVFMQDTEDMTITVAIAGQPIDLLMFALLTGDYLPLQPMGVRIAYVDQTTIKGSPIFGFGVENVRVSGFGVGAWAGHRQVGSPAPLDEFILDVNTLS